MTSRLYRAENVSRAIQIRACKQVSPCAERSHSVRFFYGSCGSRNPICVAGHLEAEFRQKLCRVIEIAQADDLDRAVHVAIWDAHEAGGDAVARELDGVGVRAGGLRNASRLDRDVLAFGGGDEALVNVGIDVGAAKSQD